MHRCHRNGLGWMMIMAAVAVGSAGFARAAGDGDTSGWSDVAELGLVFTSGNSEGTTFSFKNTLSRQWPKSGFTLKAGGIRVSSTDITRTPVAADPMDPMTFTVVETEADRTTAENYFVKGRYDHKISKRVVWYAGAGWDRNRFAGIRDRYVAEGGVGNVWRDREDLKLRTHYGLTLTNQEDVAAIAGMDDTFVGARFSWKYLNRFGKSAKYVNDFVLDENLEQTSDWRADMDNSIAVSMTERVALKVSLHLLYDNEPSFELLEVVDMTGVPLGVDVAVPLDELDTTFTASVVVNF